ncbi:caspase family protein [Hymenobacter antarcticus]|uniref:Peptidase C14 caspase domain-containing protein n=1 Tax=Hymenobacter antarcticus TaxID=486270 RepID=A0ABP7PT16_9BACT
MPNRAVVCIGVNNVAKLQPLLGAVQGANDFAEWARSQGCDTVLITDEGGVEVTAATIFNAVDKIVEAATYQQLIIYFSGHGIRLNPRDEFWLLSKAATNGSAAINLSESIDLARGCGIPHVVFISDACRTPAERDELTGIKGSAIFPSNPGYTGDGDNATIDSFFATAPGKAAWEVRDEAEQNRYQGVFTDCLIKAIKSLEPWWYDKTGEGETQLQVITSRKLKIYLESTVPSLAAKADIKANQKPIVRVESDLPMYFVDGTTLLAPLVNKAKSPSGSQVKMLGAFKSYNAYKNENVQFSLQTSDWTSYKVARKQAFHLDLDKKLQNNGLPSVSAIISMQEGREGNGQLFGLHNTLSTSLARVARTIPKESPVYNQELNEVFEATRVAYEETKKNKSLADKNAERKRLRQERGEIKLLLDGQAEVLSYGFKTGFVIQGVSIIGELQSPNWLASRRDSKGRNNSAWELLPNSYTGVIDEQTPTSLLLTFRGGNSTVLPVWPGMIGIVVVEDERVVSVNYIPSRQNWRYQGYASHAVQLERHKAAIAVASRYGEFFPNRNEAEKMARELRLMKLFDPTLGLYAAYAYAQAGNYKQVRDVLSYMQQSDLPVPFDVLMLARRHRIPDGVFVNGLERYAPFAPLLSQGWALLQPGNPLHKPYHEQLRHHVIPALWTTYAPSGRDLLFTLTHNPSFFNLIHQSPKQ